MVEGYEKIFRYGGVLMFRYLKVFWIQFKFHTTKTLSFRFSFVFSTFGAFCFIALYYFTFLFLLSKVSFVNWSNEEMWVMLGCFLVVIYGFFMFFYRPLIVYTEAIHTGGLDTFLLKPMDVQFLFASCGGGVHNLFSVIVGFVFICLGITNLSYGVTFISVIGMVISTLLSMVNLFSLIFLLLTFGFKLGYTEGLVALVIKFQDFMKFPVDAYRHIPAYLLMFALPFSLLTTIPVLVLLNKPYAFELFLGYVFGSFCFVILVRKTFTYLLREYSSGS